MATITSAQDGLWSSAATWGGTAPVAGDTVTVHHKVTMDLNDQAASTIFGRINIESTNSYSTGTAKCSGTTVTGSGTAWTSGYVGNYIVFDDGFVSKITAFTSATSITITDSHDTQGYYLGYYITPYYGQLIHADGTTCIACSMWLYANGGRYEMKPGSTAKFKATSKSGSTEGQVSGILANGSIHGTQLVMNGSVPMPETTLSQATNLKDYVLHVADASGFAIGDYISVYYDCSNDYFVGWSGINQSDEGFIIHNIVGNDIYIRLRVGVEDTLSQNMAIGQNYAYVNNIKKWQPSLVTYIDNEAFTISDVDEVNNKLTFTATATVAHSSGAYMYETGCYKQYYTDVMQDTYGPNMNYIYTHNGFQWSIGQQLQIGDEVMTISAIDKINRKITFTANLLKPHGINTPVTLYNSNVSHEVGNKVYKIATTVTVAASAASTSLTVGSTAGLNVGDRICIEGAVRPNNKETETTISAINGNVLTLATGLVTAASVGFIVLKTNRDCVVTSYNTSDDNSRPCIYYTSGTNGYYGRKCVMRYAELSHCGNSSSTYYSGVNLRSDYNARWTQEREVRGCVVRDGWSVDTGGLCITSAHYFNSRNNAIVKCYNGFRLNDVNGSSIYNNISIGNIISSYRYEATYYYNQFQYNIGLNSDYPVMHYSDYNSYYVETQNIFRHFNRALFFPNGCTGQQYCSWVKNRYVDIYYKQQYVEAIRAVVQDIDISYSTDATMGNWSSAYADQDQRGMNGGMLIMVNKDFKRGYFQMHSRGGYFERDDSVNMGNGWSYKGYPNISSADLRISQMVYFKYGVPAKVVAYMMKNSSYNGTFLPRIVAQGKYLGFIYSEMTNVNDKWVRVELNFTPTRSEMIEIGVGGRGTTGNFWIDPRVVITAYDLDLMQGPYSTNLMFGLEPIYMNNPGIILNGTNL